MPPGGASITKLSNLGLLVRGVGFAPTTILFEVEFLLHGLAVLGREIAYALALGTAKSY